MCLNNIAAVTPDWTGTTGVCGLPVRPRLPNCLIVGGGAGEAGLDAGGGGRGGCYKCRHPLISQSCTAQSTQPVNKSPGCGRKSQNIAMHADPPTKVI